MIKRKILSYIVNFYESSNQALLVTGARQTGKTFIIRHFGETHFQNFIEINFIERPEAVNLFKSAKDTGDILLRISALAGKELVKNQTLIFFDEVQEYPEIVTAIKFLVDEGSYRYIMSGSLLGVELKDIRSFPVGYMAIKEMFPLDFEEFASALGITEKVMASLRKSFEDKVEVDDFIHEKMMDLFRLYVIVGGMPAVVSKYIKTNNLHEVNEIQKSILSLYRKDIGKYDPQNKLYIEEIFNLIPSELNAQNKRFILKKLNENIKFSRYENSFLWLKDAGVAIPVYNVDAPVAPLLLSRSRNLFKLFMNDTGLLCCQYNGIQINILNNQKSINFGSVYENAAAQELLAHGFSLYYFNSKRQGELDFLIERNGKIVPIEIKSGKDYERHNALSNVMNNNEYDIETAFVFCNANVSVKGKVVYLPIYMLMFVEQSPNIPGFYKIDLSDLQF